MISSRFGSILCAACILIAPHGVSAQPPDRKRPSSAAKHGLELVASDRRAEAIEELLSKCGLVAKRDQQSYGKCTFDFRGLTVDFDGIERKSRWRMVIRSGDRTLWTASCTRDQVEDRQVCLMTSEITIATDFGSNVVISWGSEHYPGSDLVYRIDDGVADRFPAAGAYQRDYDLLLTRMLIGSTMRHRWFDWPYEDKHDATTDLRQFEDSAALFDALVVSFTAFS